MHSAADIRSKVASYLAGQLAYDQLDEWIAQNTWNVHRSSGKETEDLVFAIESKLAEFSSGLVSETVLKSNLAPLIPDNLDSGLVSLREATLEHRHEY